MSQKVRISTLQFVLLIIGLLFSDYAIMNPARAAMQDAWLAFIIGLLLGLCIITLYILIAKLHPGKTLVEILRESFGIWIGTFLSLLYMWYFIHIASLVLRSFTEYMGNITYVKTPQPILAIALILSVAYITRKGFEVMGRMAEIFIPVLIISVFLLTLVILKEVDVRFFFPLLKNGIKPVFKVGWGIATFPFGELVILLMIFPYLNEKNHLAKATYISVLISGLILFIITVRDLLVIGPSLLNLVAFPPNFSSSLIPALILEPLAAANMIIGGSFFLDVYIHSISLGIAQIFHLENHKAFILPICAVVVGVSAWLYESLSEMFRVAREVYPYYSFPFQVIIPLIVWIISFIKNRRQKSQ